MSCLGGGNGADGPGGIALLDHDTFDVLRAWETDRGPQYLAYDAGRHLNQNTLITSEWGTPSMIEDGINPELLLSRKYGHALHFWDLAEGRHLQRVDLGEQHQIVLELRPSHDPDATWGFVNVAVSTDDLSALIWRWSRRGRHLARRQGDHHPGRARGPGQGCRRRCSRSGRCRRWSPTSTCPWMTSSCTCPAGAPASSSSTTSAIRRARARPWLGPAGRHHRAGRASRGAGRAAGRRPADGGGQPGRQADLPDQLAVRVVGRPVLPGRGGRPGWPRSTLIRTPAAGWASMTASSPTARTSAACACTRSGCRAATPPPTPTATGKAVGRAGHCLASRRLSGISTCWKASKSSTHLPVPSPTDSSGLPARWIGIPVSSRSRSSRPRNRAPPPVSAIPRSMMSPLLGLALVECGLDDVHDGADGSLDRVPDLLGADHDGLRQAR